MDRPLSFIEVAKKGALAALALPVFCALGVFALAAAMALPDAPIIDNLHTDREYFQYDGPPSFNGRKIDNFTECLGMSIGLPRSGPRETAVEKAVRAPFFTSCGALRAHLNAPEENATPSGDYPQYWHGQAAIARLALSIMPYRDFRSIVFNGALIVFGLLAYALYRDFGAKFSFAFLFPFLFINFASFLILWTKAVTWFIAFGGAIYIANAPPSRRRRPFFAFFVLGVLTAYFDWLTTPLMTLMLPSLIWAVYSASDQADSRGYAALKAFAICAGFWGFGYAGLWIAKFILASVVLGGDTWSLTFERILFRINGQTPSTKPWPGAAILENLEAMKGFFGVAALIVFIILPLAQRTRRRSAMAFFRKNPTIAVVAASPFVWYEVLSNHSQIHGVFTHTLLVLFLIPMSLLLFRQADAISHKAKDLSSER